MSKTRIKNTIDNLLENINNRIEIIDRQSGIRNIMEIDIAMDDVRLLYIQLEMLRRTAETEVNDNSNDIRKVQYLENHNVSGSIDSKPNKEFSPEVEKEIPDNTKHTSIDPRPNIEFTPDVEKDIPAQPKPAEIPKPTEKQESLDPKPNIEFAPERQKEEIKPPRETSVDTKPSTEFSPEVEKEIPPAPQPSTTEKLPEESKERKSLDPAPNIEFAPEVPKESKPDADKPKASVSAIRDKQILGDKLASNGNSVHERLARMKEDKSIGARLQIIPVSNLRDAIGINEKFLFVNELFNGDLKAYNNAIEKLNRFPSIHEAFEYLNELTSEFSWDGQRSAATIEKFANLVQRRYMVSV